MFFGIKRQPGRALAKSLQIVFACGLATVIAAARESSAEIIVIGFSGTDTEEPQLDFSSTTSSFSSPLIRVTPSPFPIGGLASLVSRSADGLGVDTRNPGSDSLISQLDNIDAADEYLDLKLESLGGYTKVRIVALTFRNIEHGGISPIGSDDDDIGMTLLGKFVHFDPDSSGEVSCIFPSDAELPIGEVVRIAPLDDPKNDEFTVYCMTLDATVVPEPSAGVMLGVIFASSSASRQLAKYL